MQVINKNVGNNRHWFCAEFQLGFDPCVCNYPSEILFNFKILTSLNIDLVGREISASLPLRKQNGTINYDAFLASANKNTDASGNLLYKSLDSMLYHYDKDLKAYTTKSKNYNSLENQAKRELIKLAKQGIEGLAPTLIPTTNLTKFLVKNSLDIAK